MQFFKEIPFQEFNFNTFKSVFHGSKVNYIKNVSKTLDIDEFYTKAGKSLGLLLKKDVDPINKKIIDNAWTTIRFDKRYIEQTYKHSNKHQPLHTDYCNASIDIEGVILFCDVPAQYGGATIFIDGEQVVEILKQYEPQLLERLEKTEIIFGKQPSPIFRKKTRVIQYDEKSVVLNWNYAVVAEDNTEEALRLADEFHFFLEEHIFNSGLTTDIFLKENEGVIFQDKRVLHGRRAFLGDRFLLKGGIFTSDNQTELEKVKKLL
ncbi:MAG: TauD/TfdA family dioxygenase [Flavobacteriales bacterium]|nr:TauD/TfdA family dioxygenase [Flavobacteriales bacterium]